MATNRIAMLRIGRLDPAADFEGFTDIEGNSKRLVRVYQKAKLD